MNKGAVRILRKVLEKAGRPPESNKAWRKAKKAWRSTPHPIKAKLHRDVEGY